MLDAGITRDWTTTLLCALTDRSFRRREGDVSPRREIYDPRGISLRLLCEVMGVQGLYLHKSGDNNATLSERSAELLSFIDVLVTRRAKSECDARKGLPMLREKRCEKEKRIKGLRAHIRQCENRDKALHAHIEMLDRLVGLVALLRLLLDYAECLKYVVRDSNGDADEPLRTAEERFIESWKEVWAKASDQGIKCPEGDIASLQYRVELFEWCIACDEARDDDAEETLDALSRETMEKTNLSFAMHPLLSYVDLFRVVFEYGNAFEYGFIKHRDPATAKLAELDRVYIEYQKRLRAQKGHAWNIGAREQMLTEFSKAFRVEPNKKGDEWNRGPMDAAEKFLVRIRLGLYEEVEKCREELRGIRHEEDEVRRDLRESDAEICMSTHLPTLTVTLSAMQQGRVVKSCDLVYDGQKKKHVMYASSEELHGRAMSLRGWVEYLEDELGADDVYAYLEYREEAGGQSVGGIWDESYNESWLFPADLSCYSEIYQSTENPADYIFPVREYGVPFEPFGNRKKVALEELCSRIDEAMAAGRAVYIPYETDETAFQQERDTFLVRFDDCGDALSLESVELDRYRPVVPLRRYPRDEDGELPVLCADLDGGLWLADLAAGRVELEPRRTRDFVLFEGDGVDVGDVAEVLKSAAARMDCWSVADNYEVGWPEVEHDGEGRTCQCGDRDRYERRPLCRLEDGEAVRLRFYEIRRDDGSYGNVLSRAGQVLSGHLWRKDQGSSVLDGTGREVECAWETPSVEGLALVGLKGLQRFILSFGSDVVVESPDWLRSWHMGFALKNVKRLHAKLCGGAPDGEG